MKKLLLITSILFSSISFIMLEGCDKADKSDEIITDITFWNWKLISVKTQDKTYNKPENSENKVYLKLNAYFLYFQCDSTYQLNTSVNSFHGNYSLSDSNKIVFHNTSGTRAGQGDSAVNELDEKLFSVFHKVTTYKVVENILTFQGTEGVIEFTKDSISNCKK